MLAQPSQYIAKAMPRLTYSTSVSGVEAPGTAVHVLLNGVMTMSPSSFVILRSTLSLSRS